MFYVSNKELVIGGKIWILEFNPNFTSPEQIGLPQCYEYTGRYSNDNKESYLSLYPTDEDGDQLQIFYDEAYGFGKSEFQTGFYLMYRKRSDIFAHLRRILAKKGIMEAKMAKDYFRFLNKEHPEYVV